MAKSKYDKEFRKKVEDFFYSDTVPATATKLLLMSLAVGGFAFGGAIIPGVMKLLESNPGFSGKKQKYSKKKLTNSLAYLKRKKLIKIVKNNNGETVVKLSNQGRKRVKKMSLSGIRLKKTKKWDGKWRIVIFDIPVGFNAAREALRGKMKNLGFRQLQKSVWIIPYECEDEILFISEMYKVEKHIEIITAEKVLHGKELRKSFKV